MGSIEGKLSRKEAVSLMGSRLTGVEQNRMVKFRYESFLASSRNGDMWPWASHGSINMLLRAPLFVSISNPVFLAEQRRTACFISERKKLSYQNINS